MTGPDVLFEPVEDPESLADTAADEYYESICRCSKPDGIWHFGVEEGSITLTHKECGKTFPDEALMETIFMETTEVLLSIEGVGTCGCYHTCDCDPSVVLTLPR